MDKCQSLVERAFVPYGDMAHRDGSTCQVDIEPHVTCQETGTQWQQ
jgi:hypothetical protein